MNLPVLAHQIRTVLLYNAEITRVESCEKATDMTGLPQPWKRYLLVSVHQIPTVLSFDAEATSAESCEKATDFTDVL